MYFNSFSLRILRYLVNKIFLEIRRMARREPQFSASIREALKKVLFLVAGPLIGCATKEKKPVFNVRKKVHMATKNTTFFSASIIKLVSFGKHE